MQLHKIIFFGLLFCAKILNAQTVSHGHAHNDYIHKRPLFDALDNGFTSIEVDVFLHKGKLIVSHIPIGLNRKPDLESLYLRPLDSIVKAHKNAVFSDDSAPLILMIDFKTSGNETYLALKELLNKYAHLLTVYNKSTIVKSAPIQILISGGTPDVSLLGDTSFVTLDGSFSVLKNAAILPFFSRVSQSWSSVFHGKKMLNEKDIVHLKTLVSQAHEAGKQIRFWAIPDNPKIWEVLLENNVDWVNTNKLKEYKHYIVNRKLKE